MINKNFKDFDCDSDEGKLLLAAISILTSLDKSDLESHKYGSVTSPEAVFCEILDIANRVFYDREYKEHLILKNRKDRIKEIYGNSR